MTTCDAGGKRMAGWARSAAKRLRAHRLAVQERERLGLARERTGMRSEDIKGRFKGTPQETAEEWLAREADRESGEARSMAAEERQQRQAEARRLKQHLGARSCWMSLGLRMTPPAAGRGPRVDYIEQWFSERGVPGRIARELRAGLARGWPVDFLRDLDDALCGLPVWDHAVCPLTGADARPLTGRLIQDTEDRGYPPWYFNVPRGQRERATGTLLDP